MMKILTAILLTACVSLASLAHAADAAKRAAPVKAGEMAPDFTLTDQNGRNHALSAERGKRAVVLVFYRGYW